MTISKMLKHSRDIRAIANSKSIVRKVLSVIFTKENLILKKVIRESGINLNGTIYTRSLHVIAYADDMVIIERIRNEATEAFTRIKNAGKNIGLMVDTQKTKYMQAIHRCKMELSR